MALKEDMEPHGIEYHKHLVSHPYFQSKILPPLGFKIPQKIPFIVATLAQDYRAEFHGRVVTKISSCWVNTTSRRGIKRLGISFGSIFVLFSNKSSREPLS